MKNESNKKIDAIPGQIPICKQIQVSTKYRINTKIVQIHNV